MFNVNISEREIQFAEFPWMVAIFEQSKFIAAGSLIAPSIVLTIASPFSVNITGLEVVAGEWDVDSNHEIMPHITRSVESIVKHQNFDGFLNNVALLILKVAFGQQPNIGTICLPTQYADFESKSCLSAAWSPYKGKPKKIHVKPESSEKCASRLPKSYREDNGIADPSFSCAPFHEENSELNIGAALICPMLGEPRRYTLAGITMGAIATDYIYLNMTHFMPWIYRNLGPLGTPLKHYLPFD